MNESLFEQIQDGAKYLGVDFTVQGVAQFFTNQDLSEENIEAVAKNFTYLKNKKYDKTVSTLLRLSRLPLREPKTFDNFDFSQFHGKNSEALKSLLVKPSCLIIDKVGRYTFDKEKTLMFFDAIDRRYNKDVPNTMIFTSNIPPNKWGEFFFDEALVFMIKGNSYRGKKCNTVALATGDPISLIKV